MVKMAGKTSFVDDLQKMIDEKPTGCCQTLTCNNEAIYETTEIYGVGENDRTTYHLCHECLEAKKKECKSWGYGLTYKTLPGKREVEVVKKKRGRPKN
jgi:hypothetical protein